MEHIVILEAMKSHDRKDALIMFWLEYTKASDVVSVTKHVIAKIRAHVDYARSLEKYTVY